MMVQERLDKPLWKGFIPIFKKPVSEGERTTHAAVKTLQVLGSVIIGSL